VSKFATHFAKNLSAIAYEATNDDVEVWVDGAPVIANSRTSSIPMALMLKRVQ
jgi:hypothetical protein